MLFVIDTFLVDVDVVALGADADERPPSRGMAESALTLAVIAPRAVPFTDPTRCWTPAIRLLTALTA
jgi:hypothetical protein